MMGTIAAQIAADTLRLMLSPWSLVVLIPLVVAWVAAYAVHTAPEGAEDVSQLDRWDNGLAHTVEQDGTCCEGASPRASLGANCCGLPPVVTVAGWTLCNEHKPCDEHRAAA